MTTVNVELTGVGYPGKRVRIQVTPSTSLSKIRDEACGKHGLNPVRYGLRREKNMLDLSLPFRLSNLPGNCRLDLVPAAPAATKRVNVALDVMAYGSGSSGSQRVVREFPSSVTLWDVLAGAEDGFGPGALTLASDPSGMYLRPSLTFLNRRADGDLHTTTLASLGLTSGSVLLRLRFEKTDKTVEEMRSIIDQQQKSAATSATSKAVAPERSPAKPTESSSSQVPAKAAPQERPAGTDKATERRQEPVQPTPAAPAAPAEGSRADPAATTGGSRPGFDWSPAAAGTGGSAATKVAATHVTASPGIDWGTPAGVAAPTPPPAATRQAAPTIDWGTPAGTSDAGGRAAEPAGRNGSLAGQQPQQTATNGHVDRNLRVFRPSESQTDIARIQVPDDFYNFREDDLRGQLADTARRQREQNNAVLMTRQMREREAAKKRAKFKKCAIRIRLPDRGCVQGTFRPTDDCGVVYEFVRGLLRNPGTDFYLYDTPPVRRIPESGADMWSLGLVPATLLYANFASAKDPSMYELLNDGTLEVIEDLPAVEPQTQLGASPSMDVDTARNGLHATETVDADEEERREQRRMELAASQPQPSSSASASGNEKKMPKWFKRK